MSADRPISDLFAGRKLVRSLEFFPPKDEAQMAMLHASAAALKRIAPDFVSITYGAGGTTRERTARAAALLKKDLPMVINRFGGWLNYPEYFFFWCYHGQNAVFNTMSYQNPKLDKIITNARYAESKTLYDSFVKEMIQIAYDEVPRVPLFQPTMDVAMQKDVQGYMYWFHLQPDYRNLEKA